MKEPNWKSANEEQIWQYVGWHLAKNGIENIYSPTDCIRDRLASYIHFKARECLDQAALVAKKFPFNQKKVKEWCASEGAPQAFEDLIKKIKRN